MKVTVKLNGTDTNPFEAYGLARNPFPRLATENAAFDRLLAKLAADPIRDADHLRAVLTGCTAEFIDVCLAKYRKGEIVQFNVTFPDGKA